MIKVSIIGSGNVAQHLITAFLKSNDAEVVQVFARNPLEISHILPFEKITDDYGLLKKADLYIIAVSDAAVASVSGQLNFKNRLVVHTSGSLPMDILDAGNHRGVFYPLQTFSKSKPLNFSQIPICIESDDLKNFKTLERAARAISDEVYPIASVQRKALHVAAVFVSNFANHMYKIGSDICNENEIPFDILKPLIRETADKVMLLSPSEAQTGPAKRNDTNTIEAHLAFLKDQKVNSIYKILTKSIADDAKL